jgi:hypothetical protein
VLDDLCNEFWQNKYLRHFLLTWVQNGTVGLKKTYHTQKSIYMPNDYYIVSVGLKSTNSKIGKTVSLYQRELYKKAWETKG